MVIQSILGLLVSVVVAGANLQKTNPPTITGIWESERCVVQERDGARTSSKSVFAFLDSEWALEITQYSDAGCTTPALRAFFQGGYRIGGPSSAVSGAHNANFGFSAKRLTLYDEGLLAQANRGACETRSWTRGREQDVSATGCLWVVSVSTCPQEFDLVMLEDDRLFLGERPAAGQNLCSEDRRARTLRSIPLVRLNRGTNIRGRN
jgi:Adenomatosis polyposis coli down-regulated 1